MSVGRVEYWED